MEGLGLKSCSHSLNKNTSATVLKLSEFKFKVTNGLVSPCKKEIATNS